MKYNPSDYLSNAPNIFLNERKNSAINMSYSNLREDSYLSRPINQVFHAYAPRFLCKSKHYTKERIKEVTELLMSHTDERKSNDFVQNQKKLNDSEKSQKTLPIFATLPKRKNTDKRTYLKRILILT